MLEQLKQWDRDLFVFLNSLGIEEYDNFWVFVTQIRHWIPLFVVFFILYFVAFHWKKAIFNVIALLCAFATTFALTDFTKAFFSRIRPNNVEDLSDIIRILQMPDSFSFFSGHASSSFVVTTFIVLTLRRKFKWIYIMYLWPILFVLSRIFVGVHYPGDILVGALVGTLIAFIFYKIYVKCDDKYFNWNLLYQT